MIPCRVFVFNVGLLAILVITWFSKSILHDICSMNAKWVRILLNKYMIVSLLFVLQLLLFESINVFSLLNMKSKESKLRIEVNKQKENIEEIKEATQSLNDVKEIERFAREKYHFKKPHEQIFVISNE